MTNKEFDKWLRESLSSARHEPDPQDWDSFVHRIEESESETDADFDSTIRDSVEEYKPDTLPQWDRMEEMLEAEEVHFDHRVRQSVEHFKVPYNPTTWPTLHERLAADEKMRRRLVVVKVLEIAAIFIVFLTFYNFFPVLKSSLIQPVENQSQDEQEVPSTIIAGIEQSSAAQPGNETARANSNDQPVALSGSTSTTDRPFSSTDASNTTQATRDITTSRESSQFAERQLEMPFVRAGTSLPFLTESTAIHSVFPSLTESVEAQSESKEDRAVIARVQNLQSPATQSLSLLGTSAGWNTLIDGAGLLKKASKVRFGMVSSIDVNTLFFPEEHFYSQGRNINFSEKEIVAGGYSAGASVLMDFRKVMIETGFNYSSKTFGPDRNLFIGSSIDRHTLDFENITLNIVSLPLYLHWKLDGKGLWRIYTTSGASMHVIANATYDLIAENTYTSAAAQDPHQVLNQREVQRVRQKLLDEAKFSSKGYLTIAGGFGVERYLNTRISLFAQPMYQYQIPFFGLIDQNGKHLQNGSLLLGTRISL